MDRPGLVCSFFLEYDKMGSGGGCNGKPRKKDDSADRCNGADGAVSRRIQHCRIHNIAICMGLDRVRWSSSDLCRRDDRCVYTADERDKEWRRR